MLKVPASNASSGTSVADRIPWGSLRFTVTLRKNGETLELKQNEFFIVCAAVEYGRTHSFEQVQRAHRYAKNEREFWVNLMDGARGLMFSESKAQMLLSDVMEILGCEFSVFYGDPSIDDAKAALAALREAS